MSFLSDHMFCGAAVGEVKGSGSQLPSLLTGVFGVASLRLIDSRRSIGEKVRKWLKQLCCWCFWLVCR